MLYTLEALVGTFQSLVKPWVYLFEKEVRSATFLSEMDRTESRFCHAAPALSMGGRRIIIYTVRFGGDTSTFGIPPPPNPPPGLPCWTAMSQGAISIWDGRQSADFCPRCAGTFKCMGGGLYSQYALVGIPQRLVGPSVYLVQKNFLRPNFNLRWKTGGEFCPRCSGTFQCTGRGLYLFAVSLG